MKTIESIEGEYQTKLNEVVIDRLSEKVFRNLRRALPVTRQKLNWEQVVSGGFRIGGEVGGLGQER
jgi:capping protein (actin filament) muscle Z-line, alpha